MTNFALQNRFPLADRGQCLLDQNEMGTWPLNSAMDQSFFTNNGFFRHTRISRFVEVSGLDVAHDLTVAVLTSKPGVGYCPNVLVSVVAEGGNVEDAMAAPWSYEDMFEMKELSDGIDWKSLSVMTNISMLEAKDLHDRALTVVECLLAERKLARRPPPLKEEQRAFAW